MGAGYGLLAGLTNAATGPQQGKQQGAAMLAKLKADALHNSLIDAQTKEALARTNQIGQPSKGEWTAHYDDEGNGVAFNTLTGETRPLSAKLAAKNRPPVTVGVGAQLVDPETGRVIATGGKKPLTAVERETNAASRTALDLIKDMRQAHGADATASQLPLASSILRGVGHLPVVGGMLSGATEPAAQQFMTPAQAGYQQKADQLLHLASSILPKGGRSMALLQNLRSSFTSSAGAKNPQAAQEALDELERQITEVLGDSAPPASIGQQDPGGDITIGAQGVTRTGAGKTIAPAPKKTFAELAGKYGIGQ